jgi:putative hemolysin
MNELIPKRSIAKLIRLKETNPIVGWLSKMTKIEEVNKMYHDLFSYQGFDFIEALMKRLNISIQLNQRGLDGIPKEGPCVVICNHPFGAMDGVSILHILKEVRPDVKVMANFLLKEIKPIESFFLDVNPFENLSSKSSISGIKQCLQHVQSGGCLVIFPAGEVSSYQLDAKSVVDGKWSASVFKLIQRTQATIVPVFYDGRNSNLFLFLSWIHPYLRTMALPSEMLKKKNGVIHAIIGNPIPHQDWSIVEDTTRLNRFIRAKVYALGSDLEVRKSYFQWRDLVKWRKNPQAISAAIDQSLLIEEISRMEESKLFDHLEFSCYVAKAHQIPHLLKEIGRCRELTYREVGEGTMKALDLDEYDLYYYHLILWNQKDQQLVGAYRLGLGSEIIQYYGKKGFYTHSLFKMKKEVMPTLARSVEMGRSFVVPQYQRGRWPLFLLWKGVVMFLEHFKEVEYIIGSVSISDDYKHISKEVIISFLLDLFKDEEYRKWIIPRNPVRKSMKRVDAQDLLIPVKSELKKLDRLINEIEPLGKNVPVLIKKYLAQNARIIAFNRDPDFNNAIDAFMILKLDQMPADSFVLKSE